MQATAPNLSIEGRLKTRIFKTSRGRLVKSELAECVTVLQDGGLLVVPTDTVYGIVCSAFRPDAIEAIYALKGRSYKKALPIFVGAQEQLQLVAKEIPAEAQRLMDKYWPGPLTLVFKTGTFAVHAARGRHTVAVRLPDHPVLTQILESAQIPLASTSANRSGDDALHEASEVRKIFMNHVHAIVDDGACKLGTPSSVVDASHFPFTVIREGAVPRSALYEALQAG